MIRGKKGIELTVNFLVTIIIALVIFSLGIYIFQKFIANAEDIQNSVDEETLDEMRNVIFASSDEVLVYPGSIKINAGEKNIFGVGILNIDKPSEKFRLTITIPSCYGPDGATLLAGTDPCAKVTILGEREKTIPNNERLIFEELVSVAKDAPAGIYPVTISISYGDTLPDTQLSKKIVYVTVP